MMEKFTNDQEEKIVSEIFTKSGINNNTKVDVKLSGLSTDIDVLGIYKNLFILVECVGTDDIGPKTKKTVTDLKTIEENFDAVSKYISTNQKEFYTHNKQSFELRNKVFKKVIFSCNKETKEDVDQTIKNLIDKEGLSLWTFEEKEYYKRISDCSFSHCRYEIFDALNINPNEVIEGNEEPTTLNLLAYGRKLEKGTYVLNMVLPVTILLKRSTIKRLQDVSEEEGYQRLLDEDKLHRMRKYLLNEKSLGAYPTNLICTLTKKATITEIDKVVKLNKLELQKSEEAKDSVLQSELKEKLFLIELPMVYNVFEIIDGQHRLFSFAQDKYHIFNTYKTDEEVRQAEADDNAIEAITKKAHLVVTAIYSGDTEWGEPGRLFLDINTNQTRISPEDIIDLAEKYDKYSSTTKANKLLKDLNNNGVLYKKIKIKFWQVDKIKRTSLIQYSGLKEMFEENGRSYDIFKNAFNKQDKITNYEAFCFIIVNNYLCSIADSVKKKYKKETYDKIEWDLTLNEYYLFSAVFIGALTRLLRHFLVGMDSKIAIVDKINSTLDKTSVQKNINKKSIKLFGFISYTACDGAKF